MKISGIFGIINLNILKNGNTAENFEIWKLATLGNEKKGSKIVILNELYIPDHKLEQISVIRVNKKSLQYEY